MEGHPPLSLPICELNAKLRPFHCYCLSLASWPCDNNLYHVTLSWLGINLPFHAISNVKGQHLPQEKSNFNDILGLDFDLEMTNESCFNIFLAKK